MPNVLSPRDLVSRPDKMDETVTHTGAQNVHCIYMQFKVDYGQSAYS